MNIRTVLLIAVAATSVSACSSSRSMLGLGGSPAPAAQPTVQTNNPLALPPDLLLRQPGAAPAPDQSGAVASAPLDAGTGDYSVAKVPAAPVAKRNVYEEYGIVTTKPDGTPKEATELQKELKAAILKRKQQQNPNYGTIFNMGKVFRDG